MNNSASAMISGGDGTSGDVGGCWWLVGGVGAVFISLGGGGVGVDHGDIVLCCVAGCEGCLEQILYFCGARPKRFMASHKLSDTSSFGGT